MMSKRCSLQTSMSTRKRRRELVCWRKEEEAAEEEEAETARRRSGRDGARQSSRLSAGWCWWYLHPRKSLFE